MTITSEGLALLKQFEGCSLTSYLCPARKWTIGYGHTGPEVGPGQCITAREADELLMCDVARVNAVVLEACPNTTPAQRAALVCFAYNVGAGHFTKSSVARLHNAGDVVGAARAFALWNKATSADGLKRELRGLTRRRAAEAALYLSDDGKNDGQRTRSYDVMPEKPLQKSRVVMGSSLGGAATVVSAFSEVSDEIEGIKDLLAPLIPYMPLLQKVFVAVALAGFALALFARWHDRQQGRL